MYEPVQAGAFNLADQDRIRQEAERAVQLAAEQAAHQTFPAYPATSVEVGVATRTGGVPCTTRKRPTNGAPNLAINGALVVRH